MGAIQFYRFIANLPESVDISSHFNLHQLMRNRYSEAVYILYQNNTFDFESLNDVMRLSLTIPTEHMRLIKDVQWKRVSPNKQPVYFTHNPVDF